MRFAFFAVLFSLLSISLGLAIPAQNAGSPAALSLETRGSQSWVVKFKGNPDPKSVQAVRAEVEKINTDGTTGSIRRVNKVVQFSVSANIARSDLEELQDKNPDLIASIGTEFN